MGQAPRGPNPPPFDTKTSASNPCRLPDNPRVPHLQHQTSPPRGPNPYPLITRLQFQIPVGSQPTAPNKLRTWPKPLPFEPRLQFLIPVGSQPTAPDKPHKAQTHPLIPRLQFLIPLGCQPTAPNKPKPPPFDTKTSVSTGCQHKAPNKPYMAQTPTLWYQDYLRHRTSLASPTWPKPPSFDTKTSVSNPCRLPDNPRVPL